MPNNHSLSLHNTHPLRCSRRTLWSPHASYEPWGRCRWMGPPVFRPLCQGTHEPCEVSVDGDQSRSGPVTGAVGRGREFIRSNTQFVCVCVCASVCVSMCVPLGEVPVDTTSLLIHRDTDAYVLSQTQGDRNPNVPYAHAHTCTQGFPHTCTHEFPHTCTYMYT
jgi:hypothetical protein